MKGKKSLIALIEEVIAKGATSAEEIHKAIADMPLKMLRKIDVLSEPAKKMKRVQDESIGAIYDLIREINEQVAKYATQMLADAREAGVGKAAKSVKKRVDAAVKRARKAGAAAMPQAKAAARRGPKPGAAKKKPAKAAVSKRIAEAGTAVKRAAKAAGAGKRPAKKAPAAKKAVVAKKRAVKGAAVPAPTPAA